MKPVAKDPLLKVEVLYGLPDDGLKYELQGGLLVAEPLPGFRHGRIAATVCHLLRSYVHEHGLGAVRTNDAGFVLARDPDTVRGPDIAFVRAERLREASDPSLAFPGRPDLAVEVLSPSNTPEAIHAKTADYLAAGTRLVWLVDPVRETVTVYRSLLSPRSLCGEDELDGEDVIPGFRVRIAALFEE